MLIIGDVHGCIETFKALLDKEECRKETEIYTVGDLIDRGPDSRACIQLCIDRGIKAVIGNHEHMFLDYLDKKGLYQDGLFLYNGGDKTLESYPNGIDQEHIDYIRKMPMTIETEDCIISHAGIPKGYKSVEDAITIDVLDGLFWHRGSVEELDKIQVYGHTPHRVLKLEPDWSMSRNIDAGCVYPQYGHLAGLILRNGGKSMITITIDNQED